MAQALTGCGNFQKICELTRQGILPPAFGDLQFLDTVSDALQRCVAAVAGERMVRGSEQHQGVVLRRTNARYVIATSPPSADIHRGLEQMPSSFAGALQPIGNATALVIAAPSWHRDDTITQPRTAVAYRHIAVQIGGPLISKSVRSRTWVFTPNRNPVVLPWRN